MSDRQAEQSPSWLYCLEECQWLAFWIGPHRHLLRGDGTMGVLLERLPPADVPVIYSLDTPCPQEAQFPG